MTWQKRFWYGCSYTKGKSTRPRSPRVIENFIKIPREIKERHNDLTLCMDIIYSNGIPMFISIDKALRFRVLVSLKNQTSDELFKGLTHVFLSRKR